MTNHYPTKHAVATMSQRGITWADVLHVLAAPEVQYKGTPRATTGDSMVNQRGSLYVVTAVTPEYNRFDPDHTTPMYAVITVGLRAGHQWNDADARARRLSKEEK